MAAGAQQSVTVTFAPASANTHFGILEIFNYDADEARLEVLLSGTATNPPPAVEPGLRADYRFQSNLLSSVGNPPMLTNLGVNSFVTATVDGVPRTVLSFANNNGVMLQPGASVLPSNVYSLVILASLDKVDLYRRVLGFEALPNESGLHVHNGRLSYWPHLDGVSAPIAGGAFVQIALTRAASGLVRGYVNGVIVTWPTNDPAIRLQSALTLTPPIPWTTISNVTVSGALFQATVGATNGSRFFQLVKP